MNIIIVDDDKIVSQSLKIILEAEPDITVTAIGSNGLEAVKLFREHMPDVILLDIRMPELSGIEAGKQILEEFPSARLLYLTTFTDDEYIREALLFGAKGYLLKQDYESLIQALKAVVSGQSVFGGEVIGRLPGLLQESVSSSSANALADPCLDAEAFGITERELEMICCVADGLNNKEIAEKLFLSEGTVRNYLSTILDKLDLRDRTQLAVFYYQQLQKTPKAAP